MAIGILTLGVSRLTGAIIAIIMGVLVLAFPGLLRTLIGVYLLFVGVLGLITNG